MRFGGAESPDQQGVLVPHGTRLMLTRQRTRIGNAIRAHMSEFGIVAPVGRQGLDRLMAAIGDDGEERNPPMARACLAMLAEQYRILVQSLIETERPIRVDSRATELGWRLQEIPDPQVFKTGRALSMAWPEAAAELVRRQRALRRHFVGQARPKCAHSGLCVARFPFSIADIER